jgi:hypothetical protein
MLEKKLVTLAAVAGILLCGGCIFIPSGSGPASPPPPPPNAPALRDGLDQIRTIAVVVTNPSESHHIAPADLAQAVIVRIDQYTHPYGISAESQSDSLNADAVLSIEILSESATPPDPTSGHPSWWNFEVKTSATLTGKEGKVIWQETSDDHDMTCDLKKKDAADPWKAAQLRKWPESGVGSDLVKRMMYAK